MTADPDRPPCGNRVDADPAKHGAAELLCTLRPHPHNAWHEHEPSGWMWNHDRSELVRIWACNGRSVALPEWQCGTTMLGTEDMARVKGWKIGTRNGARDPLCPQCGRPDPATRQLLADLGRSVAR